MSAILTEVDPWLTALGLGVAMLTGWAVAYGRGRRTGKGQGEAAGGKLNDAILALLGLLLAFTFSMALTKHDLRRQLLVTDRNAISDFATCVGMLKEPVRGKLQELIRRYVRHRLDLVQTYTDADAFHRKLDEVDALHRQMEALVGGAVQDGTPVVVPLVNTWNAVTSSHAARVVAGRDRLPPSIVLLLFLGAVVAMAQAGRQQGEAGEWRPGATLGFTVLVCMVVWVTLDLNQPQRGMITISQEPLERLLRSMEP